MDEGWTRWVLERFEFPYRSLHDAEVRAGRLAERYDAIILPDIRADSIKRGHRKGSLPAKYTGGIGEEGVFALRDFVREGGFLIAMDSSCGLPIDILELPVTVVSRSSGGRDRYGSSSESSSSGRSQERKSFFCPGSILRIDVDGGHPLAFGMGDSAAVLHSHSPVFEIVDDKKKKDTGGRAGAPAASATMVGSYPGMNPVLSGWIENDEIIQGKGALVHARCGEGAAVLIGFRCQFRAQTHGTFKVLFNAILCSTQKKIARNYDKKDADDETGKPDEEDG
jgi:hypothetical protein